MVTNRHGKRITDTIKTTSFGNKWFLWHTQGNVWPWPSWNWNVRYCDNTVPDQGQARRPQTTGGWSLSSGWTKGGGTEVFKFSEAKHRAYKVWTHRDIRGNLNWHGPFVIIILRLQTTVCFHLNTHMVFSILCITKPAVGLYTFRPNEYFPQKSEL